MNGKNPTSEHMCFLLYSNKFRSVFVLRFFFVCFSAIPPVFSFQLYYVSFSTWVEIIDLIDLKCCRVKKVTIKRMVKFNNLKFSFQINFIVTIFLGYYVWVWQRSWVDGTSGRFPRKIEIDLKTKFWIIKFYLTAFSRAFR